jgi:hypothetical protein
MIEYTAPRLRFLRDQIEPLLPNQSFRVVTPDGTFQMTKADFQRVFGNVSKSKAYREAGYYHYPKVPAKALEFLVD